MAISRTLRSLIRKLRRHRRQRSRSSMATPSSTEAIEKAVDELVAEELEKLHIHSDFSDAAIGQPHDKVFEFGSDAKFTFLFMPVPGQKDWPGAPYDPDALFAPGIFDKARTSRQMRTGYRSTKRKLSHPDTARRSPRTAASASFAFAAQLRDEVGGLANSLIKNRITTKPIQHYGSPPKRSQPLTLDTLPGEIRNRIFHFLVVSREPLIACNKSIMIPYKGQNNPARTVVKRFPPEPEVALVNKQMREEVLTLFFSENKFIIRSTHHDEMKIHSLFKSSEWLDWEPEPKMAVFIKHMEVHFIARKPRSDGKTMIKYVMKHHGEAGVKIEMSCESETYCMCFDEAFLENVRGKRDWKRPLDEQLNVPAYLEELMRARANAFMDDDGMIMLGGDVSKKGMRRLEGGKFRPIQRWCTKCQKESFKVLENGL